MSRHTPHAWVIVRDIHHDLTRVLAGWSGGYLDPDHWRMSSGITEVREFEDHYEFDNYSGSTYVCRKSDRRMTGLMRDIATQYGLHLDILDTYPDNVTCSPVVATPVE